MTISKHQAWRRKASRLASLTVTSLAACCLVSGIALAQSNGNGNGNPHGWTDNPNHPAYDHPWRHGVLPTRETYDRMQAWWKSHSANFAAPTASTGKLSFGGGTGGVGVMSGQNKVYLVFYGSQWGTQGTDSNNNLTFSPPTRTAARRKRR